MSGSKTEGLASATLAQLYLVQGHEGRARATLEEVLAAEPRNGHALALWARLRARRRVKLELRLHLAEAPAEETQERAELELRWSGAPTDLGPLELVIAIGERGRGALRYGSVGCDGARGSTRQPAPSSGSAIAALVSSEGGELRFFAVAEPLTW